MTCGICKGDMKEDFTTSVTTMEDCVIIVKHVPCFKCTQCGEVAYNGKTMERLEEIVDSLREIVTEVAIVDYSGKVA